MKRILAAATLALALSIEPAHAMEDTTLEEDLSCLVASLSLIQSPEATTRDNGLKAFMYWLGRVDGAAPTLDLESHVAELASQMTDQTLAAELVRCGNLMIVRGNEVQVIGNRLAERGL